jgi:hypothetical protein
MLARPVLLRQFGKTRTITARFLRFGRSGFWVLLAILQAVPIFAEEAKFHSFADWGLPPCRRCARLVMETRAASAGLPWVSPHGIGLMPQVAAPPDNTEPPDANRENPSRSEKGTQEGQTPPPTRSPGHIFWVIPAYKVDYGQGFQPLTKKEKFDEWAQATYDPLGLAAAAVEAATLEHSSDGGFCDYGHGWPGYGKCFGSLELDATNSSFIGDFLLPVVLHQDPRYFRLGEGSIGRRIWYAAERVFVTYNDSGHTVFSSASLSGTVIAAALSNLYYPAQDVGAGHTASRIGIDLLNTALYNAAAEFWPDIHRKLRQLF